MKERAGERERERKGFYFPYFAATWNILWQCNYSLPAHTHRALTMYRHYNKSGIIRSCSYSRHSLSAFRCVSGHDRLSLPHWWLSSSVKLVNSSPLSFKCLHFWISLCVAPKQITYSLKPSLLTTSSPVVCAYSRATTKPQLLAPSAGSWNVCHFTPILSWLTLNTSFLNIWEQKCHQTFALEHHCWSKSSF